MAHPSTGEPHPSDLGRRESGKPLRSVADLVAAGLADPTRMDAFEQVAARYAVAITPVMADLIDAADPDDPVGRQFVPDAAELVGAAGEIADPIGDAAHSPVRGIVHRYPDRVLLKPVHVCPVYCRFCFRREVVGPDGDGTLTAAELEQALDYVRARPEIWEVVVTGGDPFSLSPRRLGALVRAWRRSGMSASSASIRGCRWSSPAGSPTRWSRVAVRRHGGLGGAARQPPARADTGGASGYGTAGRRGHSAV